MLHSGVSAYIARQEHLHRSTYSPTFGARKKTDLFEYFNKCAVSNGYPNHHNAYLAPRHNTRTTEHIPSCGFSTPTKIFPPHAMVSSFDSIEQASHLMGANGPSGYVNFQAVRQSPTSVDSFMMANGSPNGALGFDKSPVFFRRNDHIESPPPGFQHSKNSHFEPYLSPLESSTTVRSNDGGLCAVELTRESMYYLPQAGCRATSSGDPMPYFKPIRDNYGEHNGRSDMFSSPSRDMSDICIPCAPSKSQHRQSSAEQQARHSPLKPLRLKVNVAPQMPKTPKAPQSSKTPRTPRDSSPTVCCGDSPPPPPPPQPPLPPSPPNIPPSNPSSQNQPTPQNLRDNPERFAKIKTELCQHYMDGGSENCPWGKSCNYAHGEHELKFQYTGLLLMENAGQIANAQTYLARPCMTWISTGACPFGRRCTAIHDPRVQGPEEYPAWLPVATAKTSAKIIVDRLAFHRDNAVHNENPLIAQSIWENCRPSQRMNRCGNASTERTLTEEEEDALKWQDTYDLVCNSGIPVFRGVDEPRRTRSTANNKLSELHKLCIALMMRNGDGDFQTEGVEDNGSGEDNRGPRSQLHRNFVFAPTHAVHTELCMVFQVRYFLLQDVEYASVKMTAEDVAREISYNEYKCRTTPWASSTHPYTPSEVVSVHELAFGPKGEFNSNVSFWFDCEPTKLEQNQIKKARRVKQTRKSRMRHGHFGPNANGALLVRTANLDFSDRPPVIDPFVPMLPSEDDDVSNELVSEIWKHRIDSIILSMNSFASNHDEDDLIRRMEEIRTTFQCMDRFRQHWMWPKRQGMEKVTEMTRAPPTNVIEYLPSRSPKVSGVKKVWDGFVSKQPPIKVPLRVFGEIRHKSSSSIERSIPRLSLDEDADETWKEIILGEGSGKWESALDLHKKNKPSSPTNARNMPLSTVPFVAQADPAETN